MSKRSEFIERVTRILDAYRESGNSIYLFSEDFAGFKLINHTYGFKRGDELLNKTVQYIRQIPECVLCERAAMDQIVFVVITDKSRTENEIISSHESWMEKFLSAE